MIVYSQILGNGHPLIILHGLFGESKNWHSVAKELSKNYQVHLIDQRNHGNSFHHPKHNYTILAQDLSNYIAKKKIINYSLIGHSMGGKVAMQYALLYPEKLQNLVVVDIAPKVYKNTQKFIFSGLRSVLLKSNSRKEAQSILMDYTGDIGVTNFLLKGFYLSNGNKPKLKFNFSALEKNMDYISDKISSNNVYMRPTYFLSGERSNYIQNTDLDYISKLFPNNKIINVPNAGHWVHFDAKEQFLKIITQILNYEL
ncbi:MAG: alpha/beta hydrolase [Flavobacteriales bacterium]|nr:alpha/beta hydrolase [Flavobacteriales bacterium]|tara:strand:- start:10950 stop:11717 length:768 start_codon:yes stop_codon:yes gene_type:complete